MVKEPKPKKKPAKAKPKKKAVQKAAGPWMRSMVRK